MAVLQPFRALRPTPELAAHVAAPPYDVVDAAQARTLVANNPVSFLHVSRPEADLAAGTDPYAAAVHQRGRRNLEQMVATGVLVADPEPLLYVYRQQMGVAAQTGVVGCVSVAEYDSGVIRTHEHTRRDKEDDRVAHIDALDAHDEPVFLLRPPSAEITALVEKVTAGAPSYDFVSADAVRHVFWTVTDPGAVNELVHEFGALTRLYVADGHHRSAAAARVGRQRRAAAGSSDRATGPTTQLPSIPEYDVFPAVVFAQDEVTIMAYHRVVADLHGWDVDGLVSALASAFEVQPQADPVTPQQRGQFGMYVQGCWYSLSARPGTVDESDPVGRLDVSVLQDRVLDPILGIRDPRTDPRIGFVGGIRGTEELVRLVDSGDQAVAFSLHPTSVADLVELADHGEVMPPKSTWFEPKLRSGLFVHRLE
ncbi:MAG: DUF1015 domain-containing protein [Actinomycetes bacterium]